MSEFCLQSVHDGYSLTLSPRADRSYRARVAGSDVNAEALIYDITGETLAFAEYWSSLATDWKGWAGKRSWSSLEGDLELDATSDSLGHIRILCSLACGTPDGWTVRVALYAEAGNLESLASEARAFCQALCETPAPTV